MVVRVGDKKTYIALEENDGASKVYSVELDNWSIEVSYRADQEEHSLTLNGQPFDQMEGELVDTLAGNVTINGIHILSTRILLPLGGDELRTFLTKCAKLDSNPITSLHLEQITCSSQKFNELLSLMTSLLSQGG